MTECLFVPSLNCRAGANIHIAMGTEKRQIRYKSDIRVITISIRGREDAFTESRIDPVHQPNKLFNEKPDAFASSQQDERKMP
ncbi:hypothetical protein DPX16_1051 [Anabarilius grahami]|uniref:Uncharacterized protein n=1 Tax=Anabarilius grahami TaxID=495550 RepID=A0A3N0YKY9_ANAGA|nr:hypothetical protein DPX16_1051 [Anabarilius grahami]